MLFCSAQPWNEKLLLAQEGETLVLLENLDPSYASAEVEVHRRNSGYFQMLPFQKK